MNKIEHRWIHARNPVTVCDLCTKTIPHGARTLLITESADGVELGRRYLCRADGKVYAETERHGVAR